MELAIVIWLLCAIGGGLIAQSKGRSFVGGFLWGLLFGIIGLTIVLCQSRKENTKETHNVTKAPTPVSATSTEPKYFICLDNEVFGPFSLSELKIDYAEYLTKDTLIKTNTIDEWYEARCFECFDDLFSLQNGYKINEFGEIERK